MNIKTDEHIFLCGMTGSGKSTLTKKLSLGLKLGTLIVLDIKHDITLKNAVIVHKVDYAVFDRILKSKKNLIVRCAPTRENYDLIATYVYLRGNLVLWVDESSEVMAEAGFSQAFKLLLTAGRSRHAVVWFSSQRPAIVSNTAISQASHYFVFALLLLTDKKAICGNIPLSVDDFKQLETYECFHYQIGDKTAKVFKT